jgi:Flp pilus assembly pilin Flp
MKKLTLKKSGQGMTEYIIIVVLVAIAVLVGVRLFGSTVRDKFDGSQTTVDSELDTEAN